MGLLNQLLFISSKEKEFRIEKLRRDHSLDTFTCGHEELDRFLIRYAFGNQQANASQTYVGLYGAEVIGFYSLVVGEVAFVDAPERLTICCWRGWLSARHGKEGLFKYLNIVVFK